MIQIFNTKIFLILLAGCLCTYFNGVAQSDPAAEKILKDVSGKYKSYQNFKAEFTFILENQADSIYEEQKGTLYLKGDMYRLKLSGQEIISNNKSVWTYLLDANEVQINEVDLNDKEAFRPSNLFSIYQEGFKYRLIEEKTEKGKVLQFIDLVPSKNDKSYFRIIITIDKASKNLVNSKIFDRNGNRYTYKVDKFESDQKLDDVFFTFDVSKHPGVEIIDLR